MAKLFISILVFGIALQLVSYAFWAFNLFGGIIDYPLGDSASIVSNVFSINPFNALVGIGAAIGTGVVMMLFRQGTYAIYAMLLVGLGCIFDVTRTFFLAIPNTIGALIPPETNPNPAAFPINPLIVILAGIVGYAAFMYILGVVLQRETT